MERCWALHRPMQVQRLRGWDVIVSSVITEMVHKADLERLPWRAGGHATHNWPI